MGEPTARPVPGEGKKEKVLHPKAEDPQERREGFISPALSYCRHKVVPFVNYLVRGSLHDQGNSEDLLIANEDLLQVGRRLQAVPGDDLEEAQDVPDPGQVDPLLARQVLDDLELSDVTLRIAAAVRGGTKRLHQADIPVQH